MDDEQKKQRIGNFAAFCLLAVAVLVDGVQMALTLIPFLGWIISAILGFITALTLFVWFVILGVDYFGGKRAFAKLIAMLGSAGGEFIPVLNGLPLFTPAVAVIILIVKIEDDEAFREKIEKAAQFAARLRARQQKINEVKTARANQESTQARSENGVEDTEPASTIPNQEREAA